MKMNKGAIAGIAILCAGPIAVAETTTLVSAKTDSPPTLDGVMEGVWEQAQPLEIMVDKLPYEPSNGYPGMKATQVGIRAMHDSENLYMVIQYDDPTESLMRSPWVKQTDGSWKQTADKDSTGHENTYYEDKFALLWDIDARGFGKKGCGAACHLAEDGMNNGIADTAPGRKYTTRDGQTIDMWHWKSVRSAPVGQIDDQYIDSTTDPAANKNWGRKGDTKTGGGYKNNKSEDGSQPASMPKSGATGDHWLLASEAVPFEDNFKEGDVLPGIIVSPFEGPRGDIAAQAMWKDGIWTIELQRKLTTDGENAAEQDVQFADLGETYDFGIAVFDNSQINHVYHDGVYELKFAE